MTERSLDELLRHAAITAADRPTFMAAALARYREVEGLDETGLAGRLGVTTEQVSRLALCRRPRSDRFRADVEAIANRFGIAPERLANLLREVDALTALGTALATETGSLAAARDRDGTETETETGEPPADDRPEDGEP